MDGEEKKPWWADGERVASLIATIILIALALSATIILAALAIKCAGWILG